MAASGAAGAAAVETVAEAEAGAETEADAKADAEVAKARGGRDQLPAGLDDEVAHKLAQQITDAMVQGQDTPVETKTPLHRRQRWRAVSVALTVGRPRTMPGTQRHVSASSGLK